MATPKRVRSTSPESKKKSSANGGAVTPSKQVESKFPAPIVDEIRVRAYELWEQDGHIHGRDIVHWLRAESEVSSRSKSRSA